jgi:NAD(P)-dependent dehydrogenase (short-subunit alcohol dehydrogenase family)
MIAAKSPAHIFFSGRNVTKAGELISKIKVTSPKTKLTFIECDLASFASVKQAAEKFLSESQRLDVLMCNAGVMALPAGLSKEGYEIQFATNYLGHAFLIKLLLPRLLETTAQPGSDVRIIHLTSRAYARAPSNGIDFATLKTSQSKLSSFTTPGKWMRYAQSKLANVLYAQELSRKYPSITSVSVHPGYTDTGIHDGLTLLDRMLVHFVTKGVYTPLEEGAYSQTWAATTPKSNLRNGAYYEPIGINPEFPIPQASDRQLAENLWEWTEKELASY